MGAELRDIVGVPFKVGDRVATDVMSYKASHLRVGTVTSRSPDGRVIKVSYELEPGGRKRSVERKPGGVVKVA